MDNKQKAQQRADQVQAFYDEVKQLEADEVLQLDQDQRQSIAHYHEGLLKSLTEKFDIDTSTRQKQLSTGMKLASFIIIGDRPRLIFTRAEKCGLSLVIQRAIVSNIKN